MLRATIRLIETVELEASGESLEEVHAQLEVNRPEGFDLVKAPVKMGKTGGVITATGTYHRRDMLQEIEAPTMPELQAAVPEGWMMLHVQTV
ncbi:hypothetical protein ACFSWE_15610 [Leucobacter albus]|uniref:Uncharacterized protein n=1 Tax=Leucobacter albus TaxID=272210 RepID=A0ABW3TT79_9MICO